MERSETVTVKHSNSRKKEMKVIVISYSMTGNNEALAAGVAAEFAAEHIKIAESRPRTMRTIIFDMLFNRTPHVATVPVDEAEGYDLVVFVGPVWMGNVAAPLRAYFKHFKGRFGQYAFVSISGGADSENPKLAAELKKRTGKEPAALIDLHIADLLPADPKPTREITSAYRLSESDIKNLTDKVVSGLQEILTKKETDQPAP